MSKNKPNSAKGIVYIHQEPESVVSKVMKAILPLTGTKKTMEKALKENKGEAQPAPIPKGFFKNLSVTEELVLNRKVFKISPKENPSGKVIIYLHGGGYVGNILKIHWDLIRSLAEQTKAKVIVPDYPLIPIGTYIDAYALVEKVYIELLSNTEAANIILMGDSAGGGLALGLAQKLRNDGLPQAQQIILLSPWLDVTMTNTQIAAIEKNDRILSKESLKEAGLLYAGKSSTHNYMVSPLYGNFQGLGKISAFTGTHDLLFSDATKLKMLLTEQSIDFNYFEYPNMVHDWALLLQLDEAKTALEQLGQLIELK